MSQTLQFRCSTPDATKAVAKAIGAAVKGGEVLTFHSDLGGGKTTFVKGLAEGMGVTDVVQSPTFVLSQLHKAERGLELHHYDFYRLTDAGVMRAELAESLTQPNAVVAIEWDDIVHDGVPANAIKVTLTVHNDDSRVVSINCPAQRAYIANALQAHKESQHIA